MCHQPASEESESERFEDKNPHLKTSNTRHCSGSLVTNGFGASSTPNEALLQFDSIVVQPHVGDDFIASNNVGAESDDVEAAGDGGEDACLDVHRTVGTCDNIVCE